MVHVNSNIMYFLRWSGTNSENWTTTWAGWPLTLNLENNQAKFGWSIDFPITNNWIAMTFEDKEFIRKMTDRGGVRIGADDSMVIGDWESPDTVSNGLGTVALESENTYITSDNTIHLYSAQQSWFNAANRVRFNGSRIDDVTCIWNCF